MGMGGFDRALCALGLAALSVVCACGGSDPVGAAAPTGGVTASTSAPVASSARPRSSSAVPPTTARRSSSAARDLVDPAKLRFGDCLLEPTASLRTIRMYERVPCSKSHAYEFGAFLTLPEGPYRSDASVQQRAFDACDRTRLVPRIRQLNRKKERYDYTIFYSDEKGWSNGDRSVVCLMSSIKGSLPRRSLLTS